MLDKPLQFRMGNGSTLICVSSIKFPVVVQGFKLPVEACIVQNLVGIDIILGQETLVHLHGVLDFKSNTFRCKSRQIAFSSSHDVYIKPNHTRQVIVHGKAPRVVKNREILLKAESSLSDSCPSLMLVSLNRNSAVIPITNSRKKTLRIKASRPLSYLSLNHLFACESIDVVDKESSSDISTDINLLEKQVDLSKSILTPNQQSDFHRFLRQHREAFSLQGEIGHCKDLEIDIDVNDRAPFYIRPYRTTDNEKYIIDKELQKLVKLGILSEGHQPYTSPVLILPKKNTTEKRVVVDFRYLNSRIKRMNHPFPLLSETLRTIGHSGATVLSCLDLKSAFFALPLSQNARQYTGISSYHGGKHYFFKGLSQGLSISPAIFQSHIDKILSEIPESRKFCIAHHDDIILFSPNLEIHKTHLQLVLSCLIKHGLKISPHKCALFQHEVTYMGHILSTDKNGSLTIKPLSNRCQAIRNLPRPKSSKEVRRFIGAVNYISSFMPRLQLVLRPLHKISNKKAKFEWTAQHEDAFEEVKALLVKPPILHLPQSVGRLTLYSDTSRLATGSYLTQLVDNEEHILGHYSRRLPPACQRYSVTELELFGLLIIITNFQHLLKGVEFDAVVDHAAIVPLLQSKREPCTNRLQKLIVKLSAYAFKVKYQKGSEMVLADFLSRSPAQDSDLEIDAIVPTAFSFSEIAFSITQPKERPVTRNYAKQKNIHVPNIFPPRSTPPAPTVQVNASSLPCDIPTEERLVDNTYAEQSSEDLEIPIELCVPPKPVVQCCDDIVKSHFPKQRELNKLLKIIQRKIIRNYNLSLNTNQLRLSQETSPYFKPVYDYLSHGILPSDKKAAKSIKIKSEEYILCDSLLFRLIIHKDGENFTLQLAIPESMCDSLINLYHDSRLSNHQGIMRTYLTMRKCFYFPRMFETISTYIKTCSTCQQFKGKTDKLRIFHPRIPSEYHTFDR
ncbi:hypothetical protein SNE40_014290 [Patella caerulea]|uniref:Reverse transcriptase domain-containing protein n=1 Tax=Patella caerulea TaxID=87958 RepID=A0AAN8JFD9_PATCE